MRTVAWLKKELEKFPDDALVYAYEGEITGLVFRDKEYGAIPVGNQLGVIHCASTEEEQPETEIA